MINNNFCFIENQLDKKSDHDKQPLPKDLNELKAL